MIIFLKKCYQNIKEFVSSHVDLSAETKILDIGCGTLGNFWEFNSKSYNGIDISKKAISTLSARIDGSYKLYDVCKGLPYEDDFFDYIVSVSFFHHLNNAQANKLISQIKRVLKKEGKIFIIDGVYPESKINILGWLIRYLDRGRFVRGADEFEHMFLDDFHMEKKYSFIENIFAYTALKMRKKNV